MRVGKSPGFFGGPECCDIWSEVEQTSQWHFSRLVKMSFKDFLLVERRVRE